jgi:hypothetical protein
LIRISREGHADHQKRAGRLLIAVRLPIHQESSFAFRELLDLSCGISGLFNDQRN